MLEKSQTMEGEAPRGSPGAALWAPAFMQHYQLHQLDLDHRSSSFLSPLGYLETREN